MKKLLMIIGALLVSAQSASADLYRLSDRVGLSASSIYGDSNSFFMHGDYTVGLYSWSTSIYAQTDYSVEMLHTDTIGVNWSLIVTKDLGTTKAGGFVGALMREDTPIWFSAGLAGMTELGSNVMVQGEIGALTSGADGVIFQNNIYFGQVRADYELNDQFGLYAKYARVQDDGDVMARALLGVTYQRTNSPWVLTGGVGAFQVNDEYSPLLSTEFKYEFGGDALPQQPTKIIETRFDKFDIFDFNIQ